VFVGGISYKYMKTRNQNQQIVISGHAIAQAVSRFRLPLGYGFVSTSGHVRFVAVKVDCNRFNS
jgi:hypothetical protein